MKGGWPERYIEQDRKEIGDKGGENKDERRNAERYIEQYRKEIGDIEK